MQGGNPLQYNFKIMKRNTKYTSTQIERKAVEKGESIEEMLRRLSANKEPIPNTVPPIYTPKEEGVIGDYDIRHDRFDTAYEASDKYAASQTAKSAEKGETSEGEQGSEKGSEQIKTD